MHEPQRQDAAIPSSGDEPVEVAFLEFALETACGSVMPLSRPEDFDEITRRAKVEHVDRFIERTREQ